MDCVDNINVYETAAGLARSLNSHYPNTRAGRSDLLNFFDANEWFGIQSSFGGEEITISADEYAAIESALLLWLKAYKQPNDVKIALMLATYGSVYPVACELFRSFISGKNMNATHTYWHLLDFLLAELDHDISEYSEGDIESLAHAANDLLPLQTAKLFSEFVHQARIGGDPLSKWIYTFESREHPGLNGDAYALGDYAVMAYCVFNEEAWQEQNMVAKAVETKAFADLWLFAALHLICALRSGDMERLAAPNLPYDINVVRAELMSGLFPAKYSAALCDEMMTRVRLKSMKPSKTQAQSNVPELKIFVPESLRVPLGTIIAVALSHRPELQPGDGFVRPDNNLYNARMFFGLHFADALGKRRFSSRRANKAYLQGIDLTANAEGTPGRPKGYILAALARSHKSGIGTLSHTTDIYLKDANFVGYTPEFIAREMFERGVFSFIPAILLEMYAGSKYKALPVGVQTKLITVLGLTAGQIERTAEAVERSLSRSKRVMADFFVGSPDIKANVFRVLQNIASGSSPGKQSEYLCLMTAAHRRCPYSDRSGCTGCDYEILTKTAIHSLMREYVRISALCGESSGTDSARYGKLLENAVFPAVTEFTASAQMLYPAINVDTLLDIMEEGIDYVNHPTRETGGGNRSLNAVNAT
jgi:hypothetical protein